MVVICFAFLFLKNLQQQNERICSVRLRVRNGTKGVEEEEEK